MCRAPAPACNRSGFLQVVNKLGVVSIACCSLVAVEFSDSLAPQGPKKTLRKKGPARSMCHSSSMHRSGLLGGVARNLGMTTT
jgi:hypothetical protein